MLNGGGGNDILSGGTGSNILIGGEGSDVITSSGIDSVEGGGGDDQWIGDYASSTVDFVFIPRCGCRGPDRSTMEPRLPASSGSCSTTGSGNDVFTVNNSDNFTIAAGAGGTR